MKVNITVEIPFGNCHSAVGWCRFFDEEYDTCVLFNELCKYDPYNGYLKCESCSKACAGYGSVGLA